MAALRLAGIVAAKVMSRVAASSVGLVSRRANPGTARVDESSASQAYAWIFRAPDVVFADLTSGATISIGSARNATVMGPEEFDYVINCCPGDISVRHPRVRVLDLADTDDVSLDSVRDGLSSILEDVRSILRKVGDAGTPGGRILCHCWMGASRSVAVAIYILCVIQGPRTHAATPEAEFDTWYADFKLCRPCINVSVRLRQEVCRLLRDSSRNNSYGTASGSNSDAVSTRSESKESEYGKDCDQSKDSEQVNKGEEGVNRE